jgi:predicted dehydrogenase
VVTAVSDLRIGVLGAARITPSALLKPASRVSGVAVTAVAARDPRRAAEFAAKHGIPRVLPSYDDLVDDPDVDAIYNPLPNSLHARWTLRAIAAGKPVLCEKPFASNAPEAQQVADAARISGVVVMEAYHYRYHDLARQLAEIVSDGRLGEVTRVRTWMCFPLPKFSDIRYQLELSGGSLMDGCYAAHCLRLLGPGEPTVTSATAKLHGDGVDRAMTAHVRFPGGATGRLDSSMWSHRLLRFSAHVDGTSGRMRVTNYIAPQFFNRLSVTVDGHTSHTRVRGEATYDAQLRAFAGAVRGQGGNLTPPDDAVATMRLIDDCYRAAGLPVRGPSG